MQFTRQQEFSLTPLKQADYHRLHLLQGRLSKAADTYAFGVLLWEMYTGQRPWAGMLQMQVLPAACLDINERLIARQKWHEPGTQGCSSLGMSCRSSSTLRSRRSSWSSLLIRLRSLRWVTTCSGRLRARRVLLAAGMHTTGVLKRLLCSCTQDLAAQCMHSDPLLRPTFPRILDILKSDLS